VQRRRTCSRHTSSVNQRESFPPPPPPPPPSGDGTPTAGDDVDAAAAAAVELHDDDEGPASGSGSGSVATTAVGGTGRATYAATLAMTVGGGVRSDDPETGGVDDGVRASRARQVSGDSAAHTHGR